MVLLLVVLVVLEALVIVGLLLRRHAKYDGLMLIEDLSPRKIEMNEDFYLSDNKKEIVLKVVESSEVGVRK